MQIRIKGDDPQVQQGKQIVEAFLGAKGAAGFEWNQEFESRNWRVAYDWNGCRYESRITRVSLTDLKNDAQKEAKLNALWDTKSKQPTFEIVVSDAIISVDEWRRAQEARRSKLPKLNEQQKEVVRTFGVTEEEYARGLLAELYGQERMRGRGEALGEHVQEILDRLGEKYRVVAVLAEMVRGRWIVRIKTPDRVVGAIIPRELADDVLDSGDMDEVERLRVRVLSALGRNELIAKR